MASAPGKFEVLLTEGAEQGLEAIHDYISEYDCVANANYVLDELMEVVESLSKFPQRGSYPKELVALGIKEYRQTAFKPCRVTWRFPLIGRNGQSPQTTDKHPQQPPPVVRACLYKTRTPPPIPKSNSSSGWIFLPVSAYCVGLTRVLADFATEPTSRVLAGFCSPLANRLCACPDTEWHEACESRRLRHCKSRGCARTLQTVGLSHCLPGAENLGQKTVRPHPTATFLATRTRVMSAAIKLVISDESAETFCRSW